MGRDDLQELLMQTQLFCSIGLKYDRNCSVQKRASRIVPGRLVRGKSSGDIGIVQRGEGKKVKLYQIKLDGALPMFIKSLYCRLFKKTTKTKQLTIESSPKLIQT